MKKIGFIPNLDKDKDLKVTKRLIQYCIDEECMPIVSHEIAKADSELKDYAVSSEQMYAEADFLITLGGDGTLLGVGRKSCKYNVPILGINMGTLGFLTTEEEYDGEYAIDRMLNKDYTLENRILLKAVITKDGKHIEELTALNDICLNRGVNSKMLGFKVYVNESYLCEFWADGLVVYTPTGSTAYNLSAGGPILKADGDMIGITPVAAHNLTSRPIVISANDTIRLEIDDRGGSAFALSGDGQDNLSLSGVCAIEIKKAEEIVPIIKMKYKSFYEVLQSKLST